MDYCRAQQTTIAAASTAETTIVTADAVGSQRQYLIGMIITTTNAVAATLTLRDGTAGVTKAVINYPASAAVPTVPLTVMFGPRPLHQAAGNANWTLQPSANANGINVTALYITAD